MYNGKTYALKFSEDWVVRIFHILIFFPPLFTWKLCTINFKVISSADESHSSGWKLQFNYFHCDLSTPAMSTDSSQVGVALFPSL